MSSPIMMIIINGNNNSPLWEAFRLALDKELISIKITSNKGTIMNLIPEIIELYNSINCPALYILKTDQAGNEVEGEDINFELPDYAVVYQNEMSEDGWNRIFDWYMNHDVEIISFQEKSCSPDINALLNELKDRDGYNVIWNKNIIL
jgi:hypothetical protein